MRKKRSIFNVITSFTAYFFIMLFSFITQAIIVKILGIEYSGVNGLFTNIITMLSIAELGIGTTIIFKLYKPIADNNKEQIKSWMLFYKECYRIVSIIVLFIGIILIPFVPKIIGTTNIRENIVLLYLIVLADTVFSYIMTYKRSILYADQKNYVVNMTHIGYIIGMNITQIILLIITKNYIVYLLIKVVFRLFENIILNIFVNKHYPYVLEDAVPLNESEKKDIFERIKAIFLQKISFVINKGIDSITISFALGVASVGYYTNYNLIVTSLTGIVFQIVSGLNASVGNLLTENDSNKNYDIYRKINMFNSILTAFIIVGFCSCIQNFIKIWIGDEYLLGYGTIVCFAIYMYSDSIRRTITIFKEAAGICKEDQLMYVYMAFINLILSIVLCRIIGISGVILGTAISYLFLIVYSYPQYIFKSVFEKKISIYYIENFSYLLFIITSCIISVAICSFIETKLAILNLILKMCLSVGTVIIVFSAFFGKTSEYKYYLNLLKKIIKRKERN